MAYCTTAHVSAEFKHTPFGASTAVSTDDLTRFIEEADQEIDGRVGVKYAVPITGTNSVIVLRTISIGLVVQRVRDILRVKSNAPKIEQNTGEVDRAKEARAKLDKIVQGTLLLSDATLVSSEDGMGGFTAAQGLENTFKKDTTQW